MKTSTQATDTDLILSFQEGNDRALEILLSRYRARIFASIHILTKDRFLAEDLFQEVSIKIMDTLRSNRYNEEGRFLPWALRVAHNLCIDHFRKVRRTPFVLTSEEDDIFEVIKMSEDAADKNMMQGQSHEIVRHMLDMLPPDQREVLVLRHYADLTFKEIAAMNNTSINTALGRMRYGLMNMRKLVQQRQFAI